MWTSSTKLGIYAFLMIFSLSIGEYKVLLYENRTGMTKTKNRTNSTLASHIWELLDRGVDHDVRWKIKGRETQFNPSTKNCCICLKETHFILYKGEGATLKSVGEIFNTCRHTKMNLFIIIEEGLEELSLFFLFSHFGLEEATLILVINRNLYSWWM